MISSILSRKSFPNDSTCASVKPSFLISVTSNLAQY